jgi:hypothetical protein
MKNGNGKSRTKSGDSRTKSDNSILVEKLKL